MNSSQNFYGNTVFALILGKAATKGTFVLPNGWVTTSCALSWCCNQGRNLVGAWGGCLPCSIYSIEMLMISGQSPVVLRSPADNDKRKKCLNFTTKSYINSQGLMYPAPADATLHKKKNWKKKWKGRNASNQMCAKTHDLNICSIWNFTELTLLTIFISVLYLLMRLLKSSQTE